MNPFEHNRAVSAPRDRAKIFGKMRRTSSAIRRCGEALRTGASEIVPFLVGGEAVDPESTALLAETWGLGEFARNPRSATSLGDIVRMCMSAIEEGACFLAPEWRLVDGLWWPVRFHKRHLDTITDLYEDEFGNLVGIRQEVDGESSFSAISELLYVVYQPDLGGHLGFGVLRSALGSWEDEQGGLRQQRIAKNRHGTPQPTVSVKPGWESYVREKLESEDGADWLAKEQDALQKMLEAYRSGAKSFVIPGLCWEIGFVDARVDLSRMETAISADERRIYELFGLGWLHQGRTDTGGARSMVAEQKDSFRAWLRSCVALVFEALEKVNALIHQHNALTPDAAQRDAVSFKGLEPPRTLEETQRDAVAVEAGIFTPTPNDERAYRASHNKPPMSEAAAERSEFDRLGVRPQQTEAGQRRRRRAGLAGRRGEE